MSSSRFPGKPLIKLLDITMLEHVWRRTIMSDVDETYIALCDKETEEVCKKIGAKYVITSKKHQMCMDRIAEASDKKKSNIIVTVQGDEPLIDSNALEKFIENLYFHDFYNISVLSDIMTLKIIKLMFPDARGLQQSIEEGFLRTLCFEKNDRTF